MLLTTTDTLQLVTSATAATHVTVDFFDRQGADSSPGRQRTVVSAIATTAVAATPGRGTRQVRSMRVVNTDATASQTATVQITDGTTTVRQIRATLQPNEQLIYESESGWSVIDVAGGIKEAGRAGRYLRTVVLTTGTSHTTGPDTNTVKLRLAGGGGGGGGCTNVGGAAGAAGGGGAGAYAERTFAVSPSTAYTYAIGAAGAGADGAVGGNGGSTTFAVGATTVTAPGGTGGPQAVSSVALTANLGGAGGAISTEGDVNDTGENGQPGVVVIVAGAVGVSGNGGSGPFGSGGIGRLTAGAGAVATGRGAGGAGALAGAAASQTGGNGTAGIIVVEEYA